jgi:multiple sugar transport system ATP-binding protein
MIYVTHDQIEAMTLADRIVVMRAGRIEQVGRPLDLYNSPANLFVAGFIGAPRMNLMQVVVREATPSGVTVEGAGFVVSCPVDGSRLKAGDNATLGVRPHDLETVGAGGIEATLTLVEALGPETVLHARLADGGKIIAVLSGQNLSESGSTLRLGIDRGRLHLFDKDGLRVPEVQGAR